MNNYLATLSLIIVIVLAVLILIENPIRVGRLTPVSEYSKK